MKNTIKVLGLIALAAVIGFSMAGCKNDTTPEPQTETYIGSADGTTYTLIITEKTGRAAYTPKTGDTYKLTVGEKTSTGTIEVSGATFTLKASKSAEGTTFTVTVDATGGITRITGTITFDDTSTQPAPTNITPGTPTPTDPDLNGTWTNSSILTLTFNNGTWEVEETAKGTFTTSDGIITITITHGWDGVDKWISKDEFLATAKDEDEKKEREGVFKPYPFPYSVNGNTLNIDKGNISFPLGGTYTKQ